MSDKLSFQNWMGIEYADEDMENVRRLAIKYRTQEREAVKARLQSEVDKLANAHSYDGQTITVDMRDFALEIILKILEEMKK